MNSRGVWRREMQGGVLHPLFVHLHIALFLMTFKSTALARASRARITVPAAFCETSGAEASLEVVDAGARS